MRNKTSISIFGTVEHAKIRARTTFQLYFRLILSGTVSHMPRHISTAAHGVGTHLTRSLFFFLFRRLHEIGSLLCWNLRGGKQRNLLDHRQTLLRDAHTWKSCETRTAVDGREHEEARKHQITLNRFLVCAACEDGLLLLLWLRGSEKKSDLLWIEKFFLRAAVQLPTRFNSLH